MSIEDLKKYLTYKTPRYSIGDFQDGFDAVMELQLPVKFLNYVTNKYKFNTEDSIPFFEVDDINKIYKHWIENIYQP